MVGTSEQNQSAERRRSRSALQAVLKIAETKLVMLDWMGELKQQRGLKTHAHTLLEREVANTLELIEIVEVKILDAYCNQEI